MSDSLHDILSNREIDEPPEVQAIKEYIRSQYDADVHVAIRPQAIVIGVKSAALAGSLRLNLPKLRAAAQTEKRIILRIG